LFRIRSKRPAADGSGLGQAVAREDRTAERRSRWLRNRIFRCSGGAGTRIEHGNRSQPRGNPRLFHEGKEPRNDHWQHHVGCARRSEPATADLGAGRRSRYPQEMAIMDTNSDNADGTCAAPLLSIERVTRRFGGLLALDEVAFTVAPGEVVCLI